MRARLARKSYKAIRAACITLQSALRMWTCEKSYRVAVRQAREDKLIQNKVGTGVLLHSPSQCRRSSVFLCAPNSSQLANALVTVASQAHELASAQEDMARLRAELESVRGCMCV